MNNILKKGNFLGTKSGNLILVHEDDYVGEQEEEHIAVVALMTVESEKIYFTVINFDDQKFKKAVENNFIFECNKNGPLKKHYEKMNKIIKEKNPNYCSVLLSMGQEIK